jgi:hypothetical protein
MQVSMLNHLSLKWNYNYVSCFQIVIYHRNDSSILKIYHPPLVISISNYLGGVIVLNYFVLLSHYIHLKCWRQNIEMNYVAKENSPT